MKLLQYKMQQNSLTKPFRLYKIHKVLQQLMIQILYMFLPTISHKTKLITKTKTTLYVQLKMTPLFYLHLMLMSHNHLKHKDPLVKIMTHFLFHLNSQLNFTLMILLNKALLIHNTLIQSIFKHQLHHHLLKYKLQLILQLKLIQYKMYKLV